MARKPTGEIGHDPIMGDFAVRDLDRRCSLWRTQRCRTERGTALAVAQADGGNSRAGAGNVRPFILFDTRVAEVGAKLFPRRGDRWHAPRQSAPPTGRQRPFLDRLLGADDISETGAAGRGAAAHRTDTPPQLFLAAKASLIAAAGASDWPSCILACQPHFPYNKELIETEVCSDRKEGGRI
jgi:hypothetical protein